MGYCCSKFCTSGSNQTNTEAHVLSKNVHEITSLQSWEEKLSEASRDGKIVVANFSATWCQPCRDIAPTYSELADKYPHLLFLKVDVDELAELSNSWDINATPTFYFLKEGKEVDKFVGANKSDLQKKTATVASLADQADK
ncbi:hypothetical protein L6164_029840 [Bauhinia variegata]|uniref:Uncharacterized protein n=1 Tax=Bauhinia variegata TaxID=167791 RepID=A0ACB9LAV2_BAUVA|nr:hypothetical protein L6164_029840 [Bauhinia variegata]